MVPFVCSITELTVLFTPAGVRARGAGFVPGNQLCATELLMHPAGRFADKITSVTARLKVRYEQTINDLCSRCSEFFVATTGVKCRINLDTRSRVCRRSIHPGTLQSIGGFCRPDPVSDPESSIQRSGARNFRQEVLIYASFSTGNSKIVAHTAANVYNAKSLATVHQAPSERHSPQRDRQGLGFLRFSLRDSITQMQNYARSLGKEEFFNLVTHGGGLLLAMGGAFVVFNSVSGISSGALRLSCWVYATALIALYAASTLSHSSEDPNRRRLYRSLDQGVIFVFIAANFTPFAIAHLPIVTCWLLMSLMWTLAIAGFTSKVFWRHRIESISIGHYLVLGWTPILVIVPIIRSMPVAGIIWFAAGGLCYTVGIIFLVLDERVRYFHALWHLLVIAGSGCHFCVVLDYVIPLSSHG